MSRNTKIILGIGGGIALLCLCACALSFVFLQMAGTFFEQAIVDNPAEAATIGGKIADYDLPPGYDEEFGMSLFGFSMVAIAQEDPSQGPLMMMMQFPTFANMDQAAMEQQMQQSIQQQTNMRDMQLETVDQTTTTIRDQTVTLTVREGSDADGNSVRQVTGLFQGKGGPTMLMILGSTTNWDQAAIDSFVASIR